MRFKGAMNEVYKEIQEVQSFIGELRTIEYSKIKEGLKRDLISGKVLGFEKNIDIRFKFNYTARISDIKIINVSKSGKTADVVYTYAGEHKGRAENVSIDKILDQVFYRRDDLVKEVAS
jgi:hypothetical protein